MTSTTKPQLILISWDGVSLNTLNRLLDKGVLPNLNNFIYRNGISPITLVTPSMTAASFSTFFTGLDCHQHGIWGNMPKDNSKLLWDKESLTKYNPGIKQYPVMWQSNPLLWDQSLLSEFPSNNIKIGWFVSKEYLNNNISRSPFVDIVNKIVSTNNTFKCFNPSAAIGDNYIHEITKYTLSFLNRHYSSGNSFISFSHVNPDKYGHVSGETGLRYEQEIIRCDEQLGQILTIVKPNTKIIVFTDHGFDTGKNTHMNAYDAWCTGNLFSPLPYGGITNLDFTPTIRTYFGLEWERYFRHGRSLI